MNDGVHGPGCTPGRQPPPSPPPPPCTPTPASPTDPRAGWLFGAVASLFPLLSSFLLLAQRASHPCPNMPNPSLPGEGELVGRCWQRLALPDAMCWGLAQRRDPPPPWALWLVFAEQPLAVGLHIPCPRWGWLGGAVMESLPCTSGSAMELPPARVRSCSAGMVLRIGPRRIFPLSCTFPFPSLPRARAQHSHGGTLVYRKCVVRGWGGMEDPQLCWSSWCPCSLPAAPVFPSTLRESAWGPFATPGSWYLLLLSFFKKKKIILLNCKFKKEKEKKKGKIPLSPLAHSPPPVLSPFTLS